MATFGTNERFTFALERKTIPSNPPWHSAATTWGQIILVAMAIITFFGGGYITYAMRLQRNEDAISNLTVRMDKYEKSQEENTRLLSTMKDEQKTMTGKFDVLIMLLKNDPRKP